MKKILFDFTFYQTGTTFHGGGEYGYTVFDALMKRKPADTQVDVFVGDRGRLQEEVKDRYSGSVINVHKITNGRELTELVRKGGYDTLYTTLPDGKYYRGLSLEPSVRFVLTIHGLRKLELREGDMYEFFQDPDRRTRDIKDFIKKMFNPGRYLEHLKEDYRYLFHITDNYVIVAGSFHSSCNILRYYPEIPADKVITCYTPGKLFTLLDDPAYEEETLGKWGLEDRSYGLIISAGRPEKNAVRAMKAFDELYRAKNSLLPENFKTLVLGATDIPAMKRHITQTERFVFGGYVDDKELECAYKHAHLLVFASLNEGFGYPPLEAMKYGTMVAASVNTSIPESVGDAAFLFNPLIEGEIANRIMQSFVPELRERKLSQLRTHYEKLTQLQDEALVRIVDTILGQENTIG